MVLDAAARERWQALYHAALFETDRHKVPERIVQAEQAVLARVRALSESDDDHIEEEQLLEDALYALHALRNCIHFQSSAA